MITVYKYPIPLLSDVVEVEMPEESEIVMVDDQDGTLTLWAIVDTKAKMERRYFVVAGTGQPLRPGTVGDHIGSCKQGQFVWHVFEWIGP